MDYVILLSMSNHRHNYKFYVDSSVIIANVSIDRQDKQQIVDDINQVYDLSQKLTLHIIVSNSDYVLINTNLPSHKILNTIIPIDDSYAKDITTKTFINLFLKCVITRIIVYYSKTYSYLIKYENQTSYTKDDVKIIEHNLNDTRSKIDPIYEDKTPKGEANRKIYDNLSNLYYPYKGFPQKLRQYGAQCPTNAWLKFWELIKQHSLIPSDKTSFTFFDNAALPGAGILAINHYIQTNTNIKNSNWYACSYVEEGKGLLTDEFKLYENYKSNWLMDNNNNGDVTNINNLKYIATKIKSSKTTIDLYTSDIGISHENDYNLQEYSHTRLNIGQLLLGLMILSKGGNMFFKQFTSFILLSKQIIILCSMLFNNVYISKPLTSRNRNSECYIVCKNFKGLDNYKYIYDCLEKLLSIKDDKLYDTIDIFSNDPENIKNYPLNIYENCPEIMIKNLDKLYNSIYTAIGDIYTRQTMAINDVLVIYKYIIDNNDKTITDYNGEFVGQLSKIKREINDNWIRQFTIRRLPYNKKLRVGQNCQ